MIKNASYQYYEFFAGGGMARAGLGDRWDCLFANDFDPSKARSYRANWPGDDLFVGDVRHITTDQLPGAAHLAWASFPCQDLSLAGNGAGLNGDRSGTFWPFWKLMTDLNREGRAPAIIVLENVCGAISSHGGRDFASICDALNRQGYRFGAAVVDAVHFLPQSRPRLFIIAARADLDIPARLTGDSPHPVWHTKALRGAVEALKPGLRKRWIWWDFPEPAPRETRLADLIEPNPHDVAWHTPDQTAKLLGMMSDLNRQKLEQAKAEGRRIVGTLYKRTRPDGPGRKVQRAEVRFDGIAGCLRTPAGGSSRQLIMVVEGASVRTRLLSGREAARLMGLPDTYTLPANYNEAYHLTGDGVAVPAVRHLAEHLIEPLLKSNKSSSKHAA
ncbi:MAG: DNA cytosine methyltransferase [Candidatus Hydrogenedentes bacterium]|nr:DNA cytosine methyltransferase [Candidatus Hydrogenedentota bacterium]